MASSGNIKQITLPNGNTYDINAVTVNGHTVETDVPSGAVFTDTTYTAATANPKMDGTVAVGTSTKYAREDHVHPSDTSRVPTTRKVNNKALSADITLSASDVSAIPTSAKGAASGVAELDANGKVPSSQLPSFVDDVLEYNGTSSFPATGEAGKIYVDTSTNKTYRWGGSSYTEISASLALGETSSTAYRGDRGKTAYTHATDSSRLTTATSSGLYKVAATAQGHIASLTAVEKSDITALGIPGSDTNTKYGLSISGHTVSLVEGGTTASVTVPDDDTTYESKAAANGGTAVSLVTTGEKYTWNNKLSSHQTIKQDGVTGATVNRFGTCSIAAATAAKTVSITTGTFSLEAGALVAVSFTNANTASNPTLNVGGTGAKNIFVNGARITTGTNKAMLKGTVLFIYDGTQYHLIGNYTDTDNNTKYGLSISDHTVSLVEGGTTASVTVPDNNTTYGLSISGHDISLVSGGTTTSVTVPDNNNAVTQTATSTNANYEVLFSSTADNTTRTEGARKNSNITFNPSTGNLQVTQLNGVTVGSSPKFTDNNTKYGLSISGHTVSLVEGGTTASVTVPDDNTTYSAGTGLSLSGTTFNHSNSVTAGTAGTSSATSGSTLAVPYVSYDAQGHITATGTHTHTVSGFLTSHQTIKQDGVTGATVNRYGACDTAAGTAAKTVSVTTGTFNLEAGARVSIKFNNANTANSPTLNVNSKGAKNIFHKGAQITSGANKALLAGVCDFIYDGTQWHLVGNYIDSDTNTKYGLSISGHTVSLVEGGTTASVTVPDNNTTYGLSISGHTVSLVSGGTTSSVTVPDDDTWTAMTGATSSANGTVGYVNAAPPSNGYNTKFLRADATWDIPLIGSAGIGIPSNSDLNTYTTPGVFYSSSSSVSQTITNAPTTGAGFKLYVERGYQTARIYQSVITASSDVIYRRMTDDSGSNWKDWNAVVRSVANSATGSTTKPVYINANGVVKATTYELNATVPSGAKFTDTTYTANTTSIGSASGWSTGTPASASVANGVLTITNGTKPALTVTSTTVATGITAS